MTTHADFLALARTQIGKPYKFGVVVDKTDPNPPIFDCAEYVTWVVYQLTGRMYGCIDNEMPPAIADAYTGAWYRDAFNMTVQSVTPEEAAKVPGAILLRVATKTRPGHIVFVQDENSTVEAMDSARGVRVGKIAGRVWDRGIYVPGVG